MAVTVFKTFSAGEILTASDLNSSFTQITTNGEDLGWPATKAKDLDGNELILDADADTDDRIDFKLQGVDLFKFDGSVASAVDGITFGAVATGSPSTVTLTAQGSSTNINLNLVPKGSGAVQLAGSAALANIVEDTTPQLGGPLDVNGKALGDGTLELLEFTETGSALNHINITNAATGNGPIIGIGATGTETNVDLNINAKGTGTVKLDEITLTAPINGADQEVNRSKLKDYAETLNAIGSIGGGTQDISLEAGNTVSATVDTSETTFTFSDPPASGITGSFTFTLTNGGSQTVNWPASVDWPGNNAPALTTAGKDVLTFKTEDAGTTWDGFVAGLDMS